MESSILDMYMYLLQFAVWAAVPQTVLKTKPV